MKRRARPTNWASGGGPARPEIRVDCEEWRQRCFKLGVQRDEARSELREARERIAELEDALDGAIAALEAE